MQERDAASRREAEERTGVWNRSVGDVVASIASERELRVRWFRQVWNAMSEEERQRVRDKATWERMSLQAVIVDWPTLAPEGLRDLIPRPGEPRPHELCADCWCHPTLETIEGRSER